MTGTNTNSTDLFWACLYLLFSKRAKKRRFSHRIETCPKTDSKPVANLGSRIFHFSGLWNEPIAMSVKNGSTPSRVRAVANQWRDSFQARNYRTILTPQLSPVTRFLFIWSSRNSYLLILKPKYTIYFHKLPFRVCICTKKINVSHSSYMPEGHIPVSLQSHLAGKSSVFDKTVYCTYAR